MNALSCAPVSISLPFRRADTTLLVPTSSPTGLEAVSFIRLSIRSDASSATFHKWSFRSSMAYSSQLERHFRPVWLKGWLIVPGLLGDPPVVGLPALVAHDVER